MPTQTEENYLKAIFKIAEKENNLAGTNSISNEMKTSAASVTDMLKRLKEKEYINYEKYKGVNLTPTGNKIATDLIRKHRLWEVFLVDKLGFTWDAVHDIAEQLEHIQSNDLIERLDDFLGRPKFDPHGDSIPNANGIFTIRTQIPLSDLEVSQSGVVIGVREHQTEFLIYLNELKVQLGTHIEVLQKQSFDQSILVRLDHTTEHTISHKACRNLFLRKDHNS